MPLRPRTLARGSGLACNQPRDGFAGEPGMPGEGREASAERGSVGRALLRLSRSLGLISVERGARLK